MAGFALKVKTKTGQQVVNTLTNESTVIELKQTLSGLSNIPVNRLLILSGFPPKILDLTQDHMKLGICGVKSGDTLILEEKQIPVEDKSTLETDRDSDKSLKEQDVDPADCPETIKVENHQYDEAILGKPIDEYCAWIQDDKSWGGAIELAILSNHYGIEVAVVDTINAIINKFGEDQNYPHRVFLMFDGIHYDPLYLEPLDGGKIRTIFQTDDDKILREAQQLAYEAKSSRQFTDVDKFTLKCMVCNILLKGQTAAQEHAHSTGHTNFGEV
ncbi:hypothetical protein JTB14_029003 [Gonioctena quinquepunctata]|nr:hypothetical protein JTB14_029003 [Gonioctena quinquepunctata]